MRPGSSTNASSSETQSDFRHPLLQKKPVPAQIRVPAVEKGHTRSDSSPSTTRDDELQSPLGLPGNASGKRSLTPSLFVHTGDYPNDGDSNEFSDNGDGGGSSDDVDVTAELMPVTGFAVASSWRNAYFHKLFPGIPEGDYLIEGASNQCFISMER